MRKFVLAKIKEHIFRNVIFIVSFLLYSSANAQTSLLLDNFGSTTQNPLSRTGWTANAASGSAWEIRTTTPSTGYSFTNPSVTASGTGNIFTNLGTNNNTKTLTYDNSLSTVGYTSIVVRFGAIKVGTVPSLDISYSTDGTNFYSAGTVATTTSWAAYSVSLPAAAEGAANLRIRISVVANNNSANNLRLDDFNVIGTAPTCAAPSIGSASVSNINTTSVDLSANITSVGGGTNITNRGFEYSTSSSLASPSSVNEGPPTLYSTGSFSRNITGLIENTVYYYRGYAVNDCATPQTGYTHTSGFPSFTTVSKPATSPSAGSATAASFIASWLPPVSQGGAAITYTVQVFSDALFTTQVGSTITGLTSSNTTISGLSGNTTYYYRVMVVNAGGNSSWANYTTGITTLTPTPSISVTTAHNGTYNYGNTVWGAFTDQTFTITNNGTATLNISSIVVTGAGFSLFSGGAGTVALGGGTATFTVRFSPNNVGAFTGTVVINSDASPAAYTINLTGTGTPSAASDIIASAGYTYNTNINYLLYPSIAPTLLTNTSQCIDLFRFDIRDGGASADADNLPTKLSAITFNVTNLSMISQAALFNGNALVSNNPTINTGAGTIAFSGLSYSAADGGSSSLTLRVTFATTVTDNSQFQVTINSANVSAVTDNTSSLFTSFTAVNSSTAGNNNKIIVTASKLVFGQQPSNTSVSTSMSPSPTVRAVDSNGNTDLDYTGTIQLTSTGTMTGSPLTVAAVAGVATFGSVVHTATGTGFTLTAVRSTTLDWSVTSSTFNINSVATGAYRTSPSGTTDWATLSNWETFNGSSWVAAGSVPNSSTALVYINRNFNATCTGGSKWVVGSLYVDNNSTLTIDASSGGCSATPGIDVHISTWVNSGSAIYANATMSMQSTSATFTLESNATFTINYSANNASVIWNGVENFKPGSIFNIVNWNWGSSVTNRSLISSPINISANSNGYRFGILNLNSNGNGTVNEWTLIGGNPTLNFCDSLTITNTSSNPVLISGNTNSPSITIGSINHISGVFGLSASFVGAANQSLYITRHLVSTGGTLKLFHNGGGTASAINVYLAGNLTIGSGAATANDGGTGASFNFNGTTTQLVNVSPNINAWPMLVNANALVQLSTNNLVLNSGASFTVQSGGTLDFNWAADGTTPLLISNGASGTNTFNSNAGSILKITRLDGLVKNTANAGNVQLSVSNKTFTQAATFWYTGKGNQVTGDAISTGGAARTIICDLINNSTQLSFTNSTSITTPGLLDIRTGQVIESTSAYISGSDGGLTMAAGTYYQVPALSASGSDYIPRMSGISNAYNLNGGTIELNGAGDQILRGARDYRNLTFSVSGTKTVSSSVNNITGTITTQNAAILNVSSNTMGGAGTNLTMTGTSQYITAGTGTKPDAQGTYSLGSGTTVEFSNSAPTQQNIRLTPNYYNIVISGSNVGNASLVNTPVNMQAGSSFTIRNGGLFRHLNTNGFTGASNTAINNTNNPTIDLQSGSTVDYASASAGVFTARTDYKSVIISGGGEKTLNGPSTIAEVLTLTSGLLNTTAANILTMSAGSSTTGASLVSFVTGPMRKIGNTAFTFPVGKPTVTNTSTGKINGGYRPIGISSLTGSETFQAEFILADPYLQGTISAAALGAGLQRISRCEYWNLTRAGSERATVTLSWSSNPGGHSQCNYGQYVNDLVSLKVVPYYNGQWGDQNSTYFGNSGTTGAVDPLAGDNYLSYINWDGTAGVIDSYLKFVLGSTSAQNSPLPFNVQSFKATGKDKKVYLDWTVTNNDQFDSYIIERSKDGIHFETLFTTNAISIVSTASYHEIDAAPYDGWNYYRLRATDQQQNTFYSSVQRVWMGSSSKIEIGPVPARNVLNVYTSDPGSVVELNVVNSLGQVLYQTKTIKAMTELNVSHLSPGMYYLRVVGKTETTVKPFTKQ